VGETADGLEISLEEPVQRSSLPPFPQKKQVDDDLGIYLPSIIFLLRTVASYLSNEDLTSFWDLLKLV
jgi:hypothetical protein